MYWEYHSPTEKYFVADGKKTYFYVPQQKQVLISELDLEAADSPLLFLLGKGDFENEFEIEVQDFTLLDSQDPRLELRLTPRDPHPEFSEILLDIDPDSFLIKRLTVIEPIGQQNEYWLTEIEENVKISDRQFKLKIPSNVEVIEE
jgi:outer membrane lipoprotein-sorting protein